MSDKFCSVCGKSQDIPKPSQLSVTGSSKIHPLADLCMPVSHLPDGVDSIKREEYLTPDEFFEHFNMTYQKFTKVKEVFKKRYRDFIFDDWRFGMNK